MSDAIETLAQQVESGRAASAAQIRALASKSASAPVPALDAFVASSKKKALADAERKLHDSIAASKAK